LRQEIITGFCYPK